MTNCADIFTKNLPGKIFEQNLEVFCGSKDPDSNLIQWEGETFCGQEDEDVNDELEEIRQN